MLEIRFFTCICLSCIILTANSTEKTEKQPESKSILTESDWQKITGNGKMKNSKTIVNPKSTSILKSPASTETIETPTFEDSEMMVHNSTVQLGGTAFLVCKVAGAHRVGVNWNQISWIRKRDWHILSSGTELYTNDERFSILHIPGSNTWTLQIKFVQKRDHGMYECQVSTATGIISHLVNLQVVVPEAFILGSDELHVYMGSTINLLCLIEKHPTSPQYVYWKKNNQLIQSEGRNNVHIEVTPGPRTQSRLIIREPQISDTGNYTCSASNTEPDSIYVFVSKGNAADNTAAISKRNTSSAICSAFFSFKLLLLQHVILNLFKYI